MTLVPQRERTVDFYGDNIPVAQAEDGTLYVALRPITDFLGLQFSAQRRRVLRDEVMAERRRSVIMTAADGRQREQLCLPLDLLPGWLFGVSPGQARPEIMDKLKRYRADCSGTPLQERRAPLPLQPRRSQHPPTSISRRSNP